MKRYETTIGDLHRDKIYQIILNSPKGIYQNEIIKTTNFSRQTVYTHLKELIQEEKILKQYNKYFVSEFAVGDIIHFEGIMRQTGPMLISWPQHPMIIPSHHFCKTVYTFPVSKKYCKTKFTKNEAGEKQLFEIANRIGAFIVYILIEVMRPSVKAMTDYKKAKLSVNLLNKAVDLHMMLMKFREFFIDMGYIKDSKNNKNPYYEIDKQDFEKMSGLFSRVYPHIYKGLERYWCEQVDFSMWMSTTSAKKDCDHEWEKEIAYKLGEYYVCHKCHQSSFSTTTKNRKR